MRLSIHQRALPCLFPVLLPVRRRVWALLGLLTLLFSAHSTQAAQDSAAAVRMGINPSFSYNLLQSYQQPFVDFLSTSLQRPVLYQTAGDQVMFFQAMLQHKYDFALVGAHMAAVLVAEQGFKPVVGYHSTHRVAVYVRSNSDIKDLAGLRGRNLALPDELGLTSQIAIEAFNSHGLPLSQLQVRYAKFDQSILMLMRGEADAVVLDDVVVGLLDANASAKLKLLQRFEPVQLPVSMVYLIDPTVSDALAADISKGIVQYHGAEKHRAAFAQRGMQYREHVTPAELSAVAPYTRAVRRLLEKGSQIAATPD